MQKQPEKRCVPKKCCYKKTFASSNLVNKAPGWSWQTNPKPILEFWALRDRLIHKSKTNFGVLGPPWPVDTQIQNQFWSFGSSVIGWYTTPKPILEFWILRDDWCTNPKPILEFWVLRGRLVHKPKINFGDSDSPWRLVYKSKSFWVLKRGWYTNPKPILDFWVTACGSLRVAYIL